MCRMCHKVRHILKTRLESIYRYVDFFLKIRKLLYVYLKIVTKTTMEDRDSKTNRLELIEPPQGNPFSYND